jgi:predicted transcriptional regulator
MPSKFRLKGFQRLSEAIDDSLGQLERRTLDEVRRNGETTVRQIFKTMDGTIAYTTIMTTLDRLYRKGVLNRRTSGRAYVYWAKYTVEEMERGVAEDVIVNLLDSRAGSAEPVLSCIVDAVSERDRQLLDDLERLVQQKRRELDGQS